jgi:hypothetical protein
MTTDVNRIEQLRAFGLSTREGAPIDQCDKLWHDSEDRIGSLERDQAGRQQ